MYDANKNNNMWPQQQQHQQQFMGPIPPHHPHCLQSPTPSPSSSTSSTSASSSLHQIVDTHVNQRLDNIVGAGQIHNAHQQHHHGVMELPIPSNPRYSRNMAEKQRRDNLNANISTMASLVPAVAGSSRRMDKISILRLAAAYLRSQYTLGPGSDSFLPRQYDFDLEQYVIENLVANAGFFLVVTTSGKIVYISRYIEHQLGHAQHELLGQSLYNFVCPEDYEELQRNLTPDGFQNSTSTTVSGAATTEDNSNSSDEHVSPKTEKNFTVQRRSFNIRMSQKALNKREHGQYECLQISGQLRLANACTNQGTSSNRTVHREINTTGNDIVFVGIARMVKKRTITELSLLEATKDEYVTRHLVDGRIIFCDHRISVVAGYMTEEVSGLSAFKFMHKEDVRWTMIALRQMYDRGEGFGSSCYRLLSKTGQFIYLRTHGYLEFDKDTQTVESFVCVNTLVSEKEGTKLVKEMKERFSAVTSDPAKAIFTPKSSAPIMAPDTQKVDQKATVEDPAQLEDAITQLMRDLPSPSVTDERLSPSPLPDNQYYKAAIYAQGLPPAAIQANKAGIKSTDYKSLQENVTPQNNTGNEKRRNSIIRNEVLSQIGDDAIAGSSFMRTYDDVESPEIGNEESTFTVQSDNQKIIDTEDADSSIEGKLSVNETEEIYEDKSEINNRTNPSRVSSVFKSSNNNLHERRTPRKRISKNRQDKEKRYSKQLGSKNVAGSEKFDTRISSTYEAVRNRDRVLNGKVVNSGKGKNNIVDKDIILNDETRFNSRKRSRSIEEFPGTTTSKRKVTEITNNFILNGENNDGGDPMIYYANSNSVNLGGFVGSTPISSTDDSVSGEEESRLNINFENGEEEEEEEEEERRQREAAGISINDFGEGVGGISRLDPMEEVYQRFDPAHLLNSSNSVQQIDQDDVDDELEEDLHAGLLSPLDVGPDLTKTFQGLQTFMSNGKTIDEANVNQFKASDEDIKKRIRMAHFRVDESLAFAGSQINVMKCETNDPALQADKKWTQLQAEYDKNEQERKSIQQDRLALQVTMQHNVGV